MIRGFIGLLLIVLLGSLLGALIRHSPGYVLLTYDNYSLETSLWVTAFVLVIFYVILVSVLRLFRFLFSVPYDIRSWLKKRGEERQHHILLEGLQASLSGRWKVARSRLSTTSKAQPKMPLLVYMNAAEAAQALGYEDEYESWLKQAETMGTEGQVLAALSRSERLLLKEDHTGAQTHFDKAAKLAPKHPRVERLKRLLEASTQKLN